MQANMDGKQWTLSTATIEVTLYAPEDGEYGELLKVLEQLNRLENVIHTQVKP